MAVLLHDCPHCGGGKMTFQVCAQNQWKSDGPIVYWDVMAICANCQRAILAAINGNSRQSGYVAPMSAPNPLHNNMYRLTAVVPNPPPLNAPEYTPENIGSTFRQSMDNLRRGNWDACGMAGRKALDLATKHLDPSLAGKKLVDRIDALAAAYRITPDLKEWAHEVRRLGNDAAHDDDPFSKDDAESLIQFTRTFLEYAFTLPGSLAKRRAEKAKTE